MFSTPSAFTPKPIQSSSGGGQREREILLNSVVHFPTNCKYLDLSTDLKGVLDELEKRIYTNGQLAQQFDVPSDQATGSIQSLVQSCTDQMISLKASLRFINSSFLIDQSNATQIQSTSYDQFKMIEACNHALQKIKNGEIIQPFQFRFIDNYFSKLLDEFESKMKRLHQNICKIENSIQFKSVSNEEPDKILKGIVQSHCDLVFRIAARLAQLQENIERSASKIAQCKRKYPQFKSTASVIDKSAMQSFEKPISGYPLMSPFKPVPSFTPSAPGNQTVFGNTPAQMGSLFGDNKPSQFMSSGATGTFSTPSNIFGQPSGGMSVPQTTPFSTGSFATPSTFAAPNAFSTTSSFTAPGAFPASTSFPAPATNSFATPNPPAPSSAFGTSGIFGTQPSSFTTPFSSTANPSQSSSSFNFAFPPAKK